MADAMTSVDELLAESVRLYPVLYNKADEFFKDVNKKTLAREDVAKYAVCLCASENQCSYKNRSQRKNISK